MNFGPVTPFADRNLAFRGGNYYSFLKK